MSLIKKQINTIYGIAIFLCFMPFVSPAIALTLGILLSLSGLKHDKMSQYTSYSLKASIVLMGFGMNLSEIINASRSGFIITAMSVFFVMILGFILAKILKVDKNIGTLISTGTAICGGSAIAAVAPVLNAKNHQISFSLAIVFILNAVALIIFPPIGHYFNLSQTAFGNWAAIAIHDTSSVVGAASTYGAKALQVATTVKLIRALWIIPLSILIALVNKNKSKGKIKIPWFIGLFIVSILISYFFPEGAKTYTHISWLGKRGMVIALFLIGANMSFSDIKKAGFKSLILGVLLWLSIGSASLFLIK